MVLRDVPRAWWAALLLVGGGCDSDEAPQGGGAGGGGASAISCREEGPVDVTGTWLIKARLDVVMSSSDKALVKVCPADQTGPADLVLLGRFEQQGGDLKSVALTICDFSMPQVTAVIGPCSENSMASVTSQVSPSAALRAALPDLVVPKVSGKVEGTGPGALFEPERITFVLGSQTLTGPMAAWKGGGACDDLKTPLGTGPGCETQCVTTCSDVVDADSDTLPGISMAVCGRSASDAAEATCNVATPSGPGITLQGTAGINFRVDPLFRGQVESSCVVRGKVDAEIDYNVLGSNLWLSGGIMTVRQVQAAIPVFDVLPETSQFVAVRVDGQHGSPDLALPADNQAACAQALANGNFF